MSLALPKRHDERDMTQVQIIAIIRGETPTSYRVCKDLIEAQSGRTGTWVSKCHVSRGGFVKDDGRFDKRQYLTLPKWLVDLYGFTLAEAAR